MPSTTPDTVAVRPLDASPRPGPALDPLLLRSPIGVALIDFDGCYQVVNPAYCATYGYLDSELLGHSFLMVFPPEQRPAVLHRHQRYLSSDTVGDLGGEWDVRRRDGTELRVLSESARIPMPDGRLGRLVYVLDISERRRMEQALHRSQVFVRSVLDSLPGQVCVLDDGGRLLQFNRSWRARHAAAGGDPAQLQEGADYLGTCRDAARGLPETAPAARLYRAVQGLLAGHNQGFEVELPSHTPRERRWFLTRGAPLQDSAPPRFVVCCDDVTALRQAQNTLQEQQSLLLDLASSLPGAMFRAVAAGARPWDYLYLSPGIEALFDRTPAEVCADSACLPACVHPEDRAAFDASQREAGVQLQPWEHEFRVGAPGALTRWVHVQATPKPLGAQAVAWTGVFTDISARKAIERRLQDSESTFRTLFETVPQGVVYHAPDGRITAVNPAACRILGRTQAELLALGNGSSQWQVVDENGLPLAPQALPTARALATGEPVHDVLLGVVTPDRGRVWLLVSAVPLFHEGRVQQAYASFEDITDRVRQGEELRAQARTDFLTGAANRRQLDDRLAHEWERVRRRPQLACSLLMIDIDHFKRINDQHGHAVGDRVLQHLTAQMQEETRRIDLVARYGGEEFVVLMPDTGLEEALRLAERLRERVACRPFHEDAHRLSLTISIGVSAMNPLDADAHAVLARADEALYDAKHQGRNQVRLRR